jgi:hypothetical protein
VSIEIAAISVPDCAPLINHSVNENFINPPTAVHLIEVIIFFDLQAIGEPSKCRVFNFQTYPGSPFKGGMSQMHVIWAARHWGFATALGQFYSFEAIQIELLTMIFNSKIPAVLPGGARISKVFVDC